MREISIRTLDTVAATRYNGREVMKMSKGNPRITIRLTPQELQQLATLAATKGTTMAALVREEVKRLLEENKK